jgi:enoyl-CoA hydratase/carnithine racemase
MQQKIDDPDAWDAGMPEARRIVFRMLECDKPIIARVNGHAVGLGATIALLCDIIIAADHAKGRRFRTAGTSVDRGFRAGRHGGGVKARHQGGSA